jgi:hypothetical protein
LGSRDGIDASGAEKNQFPLPVIEPRFFDRSDLSLIFVPTACRGSNNKKLSIPICLGVLLLQLLLLLPLLMLPPPPPPPLLLLLLLLLRAW